MLSQCSLSGAFYSDTPSAANVCYYTLVYRLSVLHSGQLDSFMKLSRRVVSSQADVHMLSVQSSI